MSHRLGQSSTRSLLLLGLLTALGLWLARSAPPLPTYACEGLYLTETQIAARRGLTVETLRLLKEQRGLQPGEVCRLPEDKLARAVSRAEHPKPDHPGEAVAFRNLQLQDENGVIPAGALLAASQQVRQMRAASAANPPPAAGLAPGGWQWIGPGNIGGRVRSIVIHPTEPNRMWAGSVSGGIWSSADAGATWAPVDDFMANLAVSTLALDPANPSVLYAGTGEGFYNADSIRGAGVFKSTDGGLTWPQLPATANPDWYYVNRLAIHPANSQIVLAATGSGLWRTTNGGAAWAPVLATGQAKDVDFHPTNGNLAVASGSEGKAWYSTDGGATWTPAAGLPALDWLGRVEVAYAPSNPSVVYASVNRNSGEIWRSNNGGQSYALVSTGDAYLGGQGWYDNILWIDPTNANTLIVGGIDLWRSTDGGATLARISQWWDAPLSAHADHHAIVAAPGFNGATTRTVYFGNDGGVYRATDVYAVTPTDGWQELNNNLGITQFYGAAGNAASGVIVGGTQDNGTLRYAGDSEGWTTMFGGDGGFSAADPGDPDYFYGEYVYLQIHRSSNGGLTSNYITSGLTDAGACANFIAPFILDPNNPNTLLGGGCSLWRSANAKAPTPAWTAIKAPSADPISAIAVAPGHSNLIWVGHNDGAVFTTTTGTDPAPAWTRVDANGLGLPDRFVTRIAIDPVNAQRVYVTFGGFSSDNVWRTTDGGLTWADVSGSGAAGLPAAPVRSLVIHPNNPSWLYAGTEVGVFASEDGGATWQLPQTGPANVSVDELFWLDADTLVAATHGRGLFRTTPGALLSATAVRWTEVAGNGDGVADPGEILNVQVDLKNLGAQPATAVGGSLALMGGGQVMTATSAYPDIAGAATQTNLAPFTLSVNADHPCGQSLALSLTVTYNGGQVYAYPFTLAVGAPAGLGPPAQHAYTGPPLAIDPLVPNVVMATINVPTSGVVGKVEAAVNITHTYDADLNLALISPAGARVDLSSNNGGSGDNFTNTVFDDQAAQSILDGAPPFTGAFRPESPLAALNGQPLAGAWKLRVADEASADGGSLNAFTLRLRPQLYICAQTPSVQLGLGAVNVDEAAGQVALTLSLSAASNRAVSVSYATANGTAVAGSDYVSASGAALFSAGQISRTVTLSLLDDALDEPDETFTLSLSGPVSATLGAPSAVVITVADDDPAPAVAFGVAQVQAQEAAGVANAPVVLTAPSAFTVTVAYVAGSGSASVGDDYAPASGTLRFAPGETSRPLNLTLLDDAVAERDEDLLLTLSGPVNAALGGQATARLIIVNDDLFALYLPILRR